jgi:hypothetical protein
MNDFQGWKKYKEVIEREELASIENGKPGFG